MPSAIKHPENPQYAKQLDELLDDASLPQTKAAMSAVGRQAGSTCGSKYKSLLYLFYLLGSEINSCIRNKKRKKIVFYLNESCISKQ